VSWQRYGACLDRDPELFFPIGDAGQAVSQLDEAKSRLCRLPGALSLPGMGALGRNQLRSVGWNERNRTPGVETPEQCIHARPHSPRG
jgi:hypothetical protein